MLSSENREVYEYAVQSTDGMNDDENFIYYQYGSSVDLVMNNGDTLNVSNSSCTLAVTNFGTDDSVDVEIVSKSRAIDLIDLWVRMYT